jgi:hypothetical protein
MKNILKNNVLFTIGIVLIVLLVVIIIIVTRIGGVYKKGINQLSDQPLPGQATHITKEKINRITVKNGKDNGCTEMTSDGIVRVYSACGSQLVSANRMSNPANILRLFKLVGESEFAQSDNPISTCTGYIMTIETESKKHSVCMDNIKPDDTNGGSGGIGSGGGSGGGSPIDDIIDTIKKIIDDIPPTPTIAPYINSPTPSPDILNTPIPTVPFIPGDLPTSTPTIVVLKPFTCGYTVDANGKKRPYNVSNIICSELPVAGQ